MKFFKKLFGFTKNKKKDIENSDSTDKEIDTNEGVLLEQEPSKKITKSDPKPKPVAKPKPKPVSKPKLEPLLKPKLESEPELENEIKKQELNLSKKSLFKSFFSKKKKD